jgi:peroxiredoxin
MHAALLATLLALPASAATADKDKPAPKVEGFTVAHGPTRLSEFKGDVVILNFWGTFCPPCVDDLDAYAAQDAALRAEGIRIVAVNIDEKHELEGIERMAKARSWDFPIVLDPTRRIVGSYHSKRSVPVTAVIDADGVLKELHLSWDEGDVEQAIEEARELRAAAAPPAEGTPAEADGEKAVEDADKDAADAE